MSEINNEVKQQDILIYRNGAESLIKELLKGKDINWGNDAIWIILINQGNQSSIKQTKALKWLENVMKKRCFETEMELMLILDVFTDLLSEIA